MAKKEKAVLEKPVIEEVKEPENQVVKDEVFIDTGKEDKIIITPVGSVKFPCPNCGKSQITRSFNQRMLATPYKCEKCDFVGPN